MNLEALNWKLQSDDHFDDIKQRPSVTPRGVMEDAFAGGFHTLKSVTWLMTGISCSA